MSTSSLADRFQNFIYDVTVRFSPFVIMGGIALFSYWLLKASSPDEGALPPKIKAHVPDYAFENFIVTALNEQGTTKYRLIGKKMVHYEDDASIDLEQPKARFFSDTAPPLTIVAKRGHLDGDITILELFDDAVISRPKELSASGTVINPHLKANSNYFKVFINDDIVKSHLPIRLERGDSVVTASKGLEFDNIMQRTVLFGDVKGLLIPSGNGR